MKSYIIVATLLLATSCSTIKIPGLDRTTVTRTEKTSTIRSKAGKSGAPAQSSTTSVEENSISTRHEAESKSSKSATPDLAGEWFIKSLMGVDTRNSDNAPSLNIDCSTNHFYATDGCNYFTGSIKAGADGSLSFSDVISTLRHCPELDWNGILNEILNKSLNYTLSHANGQSTLVLVDSRGVEVMKAVRHNDTDLNGLWEVMELNRRAVSKERPTIVIDLPERCIHGNTGCNIFSGEIYQAASPSMSVQFLGMEVTKHPCDQTDVERELMIALELTEQARIISSGEALLLDAQGNELIHLKRP